MSSNLNKRLCWKTDSSGQWRGVAIQKKLLSQDGTAEAEGQQFTHSRWKGSQISTAKGPETVVWEEAPF